MRRATAVRRLRTIAERCQQVCSLWEVGSGLVAVHAFGPVLDVGEDEEPSIEVIQIALVVNEPPDEVTWCVRPARYTGLPYVLDLEKAPVDWYYRAASQPVGNHRIVRPLPIWTRDGGVLDPALTALAERDATALDRLREPGVRPVALQRQLADDLAASGRHLARVRDAYWSRRWRQAHHAAGVYPENYLWDAVNGYLDLQAALDGGPEPSPPGRVTDPEPDPRTVPGRSVPGRRAATEVGEPLPLELDADAEPEPEAAREAEPEADPQVRAAAEVDAGEGAAPSGSGGAVPVLDPAEAPVAGAVAESADAPVAAPAQVPVEGEAARAGSPAEPRGGGARSRGPGSRGAKSDSAGSPAAQSRSAASGGAGSGGSERAKKVGEAPGRAAGSGPRKTGTRAAGDASTTRKAAPRKAVRRPSGPALPAEADHPG